MGSWYFRHLVRSSLRRNLTTGLAACHAVTAPQSFTSDEVYALIAWLLHQNGIVPTDAVMDVEPLLAVTMPNREGFIQLGETTVPTGDGQAGENDL